MHSSATTVYTPNAFFQCLKSSISQPFFAAGSLVERVYFPLHRHMRTQAYATITSWIHMLKLKRLLSSASVRAWSWDARDKEPTEWRISTNEHHQRNMNFFCTTLRSFVPLCVMFPRSLDSTGATPTFNVQMALALMRRQLPAEQQRLCEWCVGLALTTASKDDLWNLVNIVTACACHLQLKLWAFWDLRPIACWNCRNWKKLFCLKGFDSQTYCFLWFWDAWGSQGYYVAQRTTVLYTTNTSVTTAGLSNSLSSVIAANSRIWKQSRLSAPFETQILESKVSDRWRCSWGLLCLQSSWWNKNHERICTLSKITRVTSQEGKSESQKNVARVSTKAFIWDQCIRGMSLPVHDIQQTSRFVHIVHRWFLRTKGLPGLSPQSLTQISISTFACKESFRVWNGGSLKAVQANVKAVGGKVPTKRVGADGTSQATMPVRWSARWFAKWLARDLWSQLNLTKRLPWSASTWHTRKPKRLNPISIFWSSSTRWPFVNQVRLVCGTCSWQTRVPGVGMSWRDLLGRRNGQSRLQEQL